MSLPGVRDAARLRPRFTPRRTSFPLPPVAQVETTSTVLMKSMVMQSDALTFIPKELIYWEVRAGQLKALEATGNQWERRVGITRRRKGTLSPASKLLMQAVKSVAQDF